MLFKTHHLHHLMANAISAIFINFVCHKNRGAEDDPESVRVPSHVNLIPVIELIHAYENIKCEKCGLLLWAKWSVLHISF